MRGEKTGRAIESDSFQGESPCACVDFVALGLILVATGVDRGFRAVASAAGRSGYLLPPKVIVDILDAPPPPTAELSPTRDVVALLERASMPTIAELAQPMLRHRRACASTRAPTARIARNCHRAHHAEDDRRRRARRR